MQNVNLELEQNEEVVFPPAFITCLVLRSIIVSNVNKLNLYSLPHSCKMLDLEQDE